MARGCRSRAPGLPQAPHFFHYLVYQAQKATVRTPNPTMTEQAHHYYHSHPVGEHDVICGKKCEKHPGNAAFRKIVFEFRHQYQTTSTRDMKKQIIEQVIARVHQLGGRFIKENDDETSMVDVTQQYIYEKVSHALRSARPTNSAKAIQKSHAERKHGFDDLLATQQKLFYTYLMASNNGEDDDSAASTASEDSTLPRVNVSSSKPPARRREESQQRPTPLCSIMDETTLSVLLELQQPV